MVVKAMAVGGGMSELSSWEVLHAPVYLDGGKVGLSVYVS